MKISERILPTSSRARILIKGDMKALHTLEVLYNFSKHSSFNRLFADVCRRERVITKDFLEHNLQKPGFDRIELLLAYIVTNKKPTATSFTFATWTEFDELQTLWRMTKREMRKENVETHKRIKPWILSPIDVETGKARPPCCWSYPDPRPVIAVFRNKNLRHQSETHQ